MVKRFGVSMEKSLLDKFDRIIKKKGYENRSEALRDLVRNYIVEEEWREEGEVLGIVSLIFHPTSKVSEELLKLQHLHHTEITSSMHLHLDEENCLEVLVLRGEGDKVKEVSNKLISMKGVKHGKFIKTTLGKNI